MGRSESGSWETCAGACTSVICEVLQTTQEDLANGRPNLDCHPSLYFCLGFLTPTCTSLLGQVRCFVLEQELFTNPAVPMLTTNCFQNWRITMEQQEVRICPFCIQLSSLLCSSQSFPSDRTAGVSWSICTVTNKFWSWTKTCASSFVCTSPPTVSTTVGLLDLRKVYNLSELKSFLLIMCIDAPESTGMLVPLQILKWRRHCPWFNRSIKRSFVRILELVNIFASSHATLRLPRALREFDGVIRSQVWNLSEGNLWTHKPVV